MQRVVTLLTDFGTLDGYVGAMKGVILSLAPHVQIVDLTHDIPPQDVAAGARALREAAPLFPPGTIHVAVVDPGVGTARRPLALCAEEQTYVGPDNGLLSLACDGASPRAWALDRDAWFRADVSLTFHGRDLFAPVAGHLAAGASLDEMGTEVRQWERLTIARPSERPDAVTGEVVHVDRFGNLITNIAGGMLEASSRWRVRCGGQDIGPVRRTFADVAPGALVAYVGSSGELEIAVRDGCATQRLGGRGMEVVACRI